MTALSYISAAAAFSDYFNVKFATSAHQTIPEVLTAPQKALAQLHPSPLTTSPICSSFLQLTGVSIPGIGSVYW